MTDFGKRILDGYSRRRKAYEAGDFSSLTEWDVQSFREIDAFLAGEYDKIDPEHLELLLALKEGRKVVAKNRTEDILGDWEVKGYIFLLRPDSESWKDGMKWLRKSMISYAIQMSEENQVCERFYMDLTRKNLDGMADAEIRKKIDAMSGPLREKLALSAWKERSHRLAKLEILPKDFLPRYVENGCDPKTCPTAMRWDPVAKAGVYVNPVAARIAIARAREEFEKKMENLVCKAHETEPEVKPKDKHSEDKPPSSCQQSPPPIRKVPDPNPPEEDKQTIEPLTKNEQEHEEQGKNEVSAGGSEGPRTEEEDLSWLR